MSKFFNLVDPASVERVDLIAREAGYANSATNNRASNSAIIDRVNITNTHASNDVKISLYLQQDALTITGAAYNNSTAVAHTASLDYKGNNKVLPGMEVSGTGIADKYVETVTNTTNFVLSGASTGGALTGQTLTLTNKNYIIDDVIIPAGVTLILDNKITFSMTTHKLVIQKSNTNTTITVIVN